MLDGEPALDRLLDEIRAFRRSEMPNYPDMNCQDVEKRR